MTLRVFLKIPGTTDANGKITQTQMTDPRGMIERVSFDSAGLATSQTVAPGKPEEQITSFERFPTTNLMKAVVDPLLRRTEFTYDPMGNVLTSTNNAGTADAVTSTFTYEPTFNLVKTAKNPLQKTTIFDYFPKGNLKTVTDPLGSARY